MRKLHTIVSLSAALIALPILHSATVADPPDDFDTFMAGALADFDSFMDEANRDFVEFMRNPWKKFDAEKPVEKRLIPEPVVQPEVKPETKPDSTPHRLTIEEIIDLTTGESGDKKGDSAGGDAGSPLGFKEDAPKAKKPVKVQPVKPQPKPVPVKTEPKSEKADPVKETPPAVKKPVTPQPLPAETEGMPIQFGGVTYRISDALAGKVPAVKLNEKSIANAYEALLKSDYKPLVQELARLRNDGLNNDWALFMFIKDIAGRFTTGNGVQVLRQFLLNQLGFRARVALVPSENRLALYFAPNVDLYGVVFTTVDGVKYYDIDAKMPYPFFMCQREAPAAKNKLSMNISSLPSFRSTAATSTHTGSGRSAGMSVTMSVPKMLADFYSSLPQCDYSVYANATPYQDFEASVLPQLRSAIEGKSETEAVTMLLDYVQHAFEYATDDQQFGFEKPFFVEELYYYPKCDCEDRSIFFRYLVRKLLGLDVVLLEYPNHLATAVRFNTPQNGSYVTVGGTNYTVCDPTYIGAGIGMAMPMFRNTTAKVVKL